MSSSIGPMVDEREMAQGSSAYQPPSITDEANEAGEADEAACGVPPRQEGVEDGQAPAEESQSVHDQINEAIRRLTVTHEDVVIAVMGMTGVGKSKFISYLTPNEIHIGHTLKAGTTIVETFPCPYAQGRTIHLVDTPGFNDPKKSDAEILELVSVFMSALYTQNIKLAGVIYLHSITDVRMFGSSSLNLELFEKLCGKEGMNKTVLATTKWDCLPSQEDGERREQELKDDFWSEMIVDGSRVFRQDSGFESAMRIVRYLMELDGEGIVPTVAPQLVDQGMRHKDTSVGKVLRKEHLKIEAEHAKKVKRLETKHAEAIAQGNQERADAIAKEQEKVAAAIQKHEASMKIMNSSLADSQRKLASFQAQQEQAEKEKMESDRKLKALQSQHADLQTDLDNQKKDKIKDEKAWNEKIGKLEEQMQKDKDDHRAGMAHATEKRRGRSPKGSLGVMAAGLVTTIGSLVTFNPFGVAAGISLMSGGGAVAVKRISEM